MCTLFVGCYVCSQILSDAPPRGAVATLSRQLRCYPQTQVTQVPKRAAYGVQTLIQWHWKRLWGSVCFNLATKQCEVPVLKTKLRLPHRWNCKPCPKTPEWNPLRHVPQRTIGKTPETRFVWCLQLWKSWNKLAEDHTCCIIIAADQSWGLQAWERAFIFQITQIGDDETLISFYLKTNSIYWTSLDGLLTGAISF